MTRAGIYHILPVQILFKKNPKFQAGYMFSEKRLKPR